MTMVEERPSVTRPIFGEITLEDMQGNALLTQTVMRRIAEVCAHTKGRYTAETVADGVLAGDFLVYGVMRPPAALEAVAVAAVVDGCFVIFLVGPEGRDVFTFLPALESISRQKRCSSMRVHGPSFFRRQLPKDFHIASIVYEKALSPVHA